MKSNTPTSQPARTYKRYQQTIARFWHASIAAEAEYRINFITAALTSIIGLTGSIYVLSLLFTDSSTSGNSSPNSSAVSSNTTADLATLAGWTWPQALMIVGFFNVLDGLQATFLAPNRMLVSEMVRSGFLDFVLLKPIDSQYWVSVRQISLWGLPRFILGVALSLYAGTQIQPSLQITDYIRGILPVFFAFITLYSIGHVLSTLSIWFIKLFNIVFAMQALLEAGRYPIQAYPAIYRLFFTFILPVAFLTTVPAQSVLQKPNHINWLIGSACVAILSFGFARWFWHFALRSYTSASS